MKCFDLSEAKVIIKQNIISKIKKFFVIFSTPGYDVREILESYQDKLWLRNYFFDYCCKF